MSRLLAIIFFLCISPFGPALAENGWLVGVAGGLVSFDDETDVIDTGNLNLRAGYAIGDHLEVGASYGFTLLADDINNVDHDVEIAFAYIKGKLPIDDNSVAYLMLGSTRVKLKEAIRDSSTRQEDDGNGFGIGVEVRAGESIGYSAEYVEYYDDDEFDGARVDVNTSGINFGFVKYF